MSNEPKKTPLNSNRLEALGDGIFAVAATILILDIRLPEGGKFESNSSFIAFVSDVAPNVICYFVTFAIIGIMGTSKLLRRGTSVFQTRSLLYVNEEFEKSE